MAKYTKMTKKKKKGDTSSVKKHVLEKELKNRKKIQDTQ